MRLNTEENLRRFLTISKSSNYKKQKINQSPIDDQNINNIYTSTIYNQSKSNKNISLINTKNKPFSLLSKLSSRQKEKLNISKFFKSKMKYYNNIDLITNQKNQKKNVKEELNNSIDSKFSKQFNYKTLNYDQTSYGRIMKYFTNKSSNKPMKFDEISQVFVPIRNTLSNEHRNKNEKINTKKKEYIKDKINLYLLDSKDSVIQLFKNNKFKKNLNSQKNNSKSEKEQINKSQNKMEQINPNQEKKNENDINYNNIKTIYNNTEGNNNNKNSLKTSYQYRIRKINLPSGINFASIQSNNKLLHNLLNKKQKIKSKK